MKIPISKINPNPETIRDGIGVTAIEELTISMKSMGQLTPILVTVNHDKQDEYDVLDGDHRLLAAKKNGFKTMDAVVINQDPEANSERYVKSIIVNLQREDLTFREKAKTFKKMTSCGYSNKQIYEMTGCSENMINTLKFYSELEPEIQKILDDGKLNANTKMLSLLCGLPTGKERITICEYAANQGLSGPSTIALLQVIKQSYKLEDEVREFFIAGTVPYDVSVIELLLMLKNVQQRLHLIEKFIGLKLNHMEIRQVSGNYVEFLKRCPEFSALLIDFAFPIDSEILIEIADLPVPDKRLFIVKKVLEYNLSKNQAIVLFSAVSQILEFSSEIQELFWNDKLPLDSRFIHLVGTMPPNLETRMGILSEFIGKNFAIESLCKKLEQEIQEAWAAIRDVSNIAALSINEVAEDPSAAVDTLLVDSIQKQPVTITTSATNTTVKTMVLPFQYIEDFFSEAKYKEPQKAERAKSVIISLSKANPETGSIFHVINNICGNCECREDSRFTSNFEICRVCKLGLLLDGITSEEGTDV